MEEDDAEETSQEEIETTWPEDNKKACYNSIRITYEDICIMDYEEVEDLVAWNLSFGISVKETLEELKSLNIVYEWDIV